jgi:hypothetical protein
MGCDPPTFSADDIAKMTNKIDNLATLVTGAAGAGAGGGGGGGRSGGSGGLLNMFTCDVDSDCYKSKHDQYLKQIYSDKSIDLANAPIDLSRAEKNYYTYNRGANGGPAIYNKLIIDRFAKTAEQFKANSIETQQEYMADLVQSLKQYQAALIFQKQIKKLLKVRQAEQANLMNNINYYQTVVQTSERKVVYENKNMDSLYSYRRMLFFIYYAGLVSYILFGNFIPDKLYTNYSVWLIIVLTAIFPIILNILLKWGFIIADTLSYWFADLPHKDVYMEGNPPLRKSHLEGKPPTPPTLGV